METTAYEIEKLGLQVYESHYEDFVKAPHIFIYKLMEYMQLPPSKHVDAYMQNLFVANRNERASKKTPFSEETKKRILEIVSA